MQKKSFLALLSLLFVLVFLAACSGDGATGENEGDSGTTEEQSGTTEEESEATEAEGESMVLRLSEVHPDDYPTTIGNKEFARLVEERTNGRIKIEVYPGGQLGTERDVMEQVQLGTIEMARINGVPLSEFVPDMGVLSLPYLFESEEDKWEKLLGEPGQELLDSFVGSGIIGLTFYNSGERSFYNSVRPITKPADMEGLKIRVQNSQLAIDIVEALGASATPMEYGEVYSALQTGLVDGAENNFPSYYTSNHYQVAKYYTVNGYTGPPEVLIISEVIWNKLSDEDKQIFKEAAMESVEVQFEAWDKLTEDSRNAVVEAGTELVEVDDVSEWREALQPIYDKYGSEYSDWIEKFSN